MAVTLHPVQRAPTRPSRYEAPVTLDDARELLITLGDRARPIAGGTDLLVELDRAAHESVDTLVDLGRIPGLDHIEVGPDTLHLGALVTHAQVVAEPACRELALPLAQACLEIGSPQLRNRATVVGNVVTASPANDTISALLALGASVEVSSTEGQRSEPLAEFITGFRETTLGRGELVTGIVVPTVPADRRAVFVKAGLRRAQAISVVHLAATVTFDDDERVTEATLALGSVAPTVVLVSGLAERMAGRRLDTEAISVAVDAADNAAQPIDDLRASARYRRDLVRVMTQRAFEALADNRQADAWPPNPPLLWGVDFDGTFATDDVAAVSVGIEDPVHTIVNGVAVAATRAPSVTLLDWLRSEVGLTGVKEGCAEGECGACTVDLDGAGVMACLVPAARAAGAEIVTVEGLAEGEQLHAVQQAFIDTGAVQCGFCTPGLLMSCAKLLEEQAAPTRDEVRAGLAGNLCRCTGYGAIEAAVAIVAGDRSRS